MSFQTDNSLQALNQPTHTIKISHYFITRLTSQIIKNQKWVTATRNSPPSSSPPTASMTGSKSKNKATASFGCTESLTNKSKPTLSPNPSSVIRTNSRSTTSAKLTAITSSSSKPSSPLATLHFVRSPERHTHWFRTSLAG